MRPASMAAAFALLLGCAGTASAQQADDDVRSVQTTTYRIAAIKWEYEPMARAVAFYEENRPRYAPNSSLRFRLPAQVKGAPDKQALTLLGANSSETIELDDAKSFALPKLAGGAAGDASVVADGYFNKGSYLLLVPVVRTAALPSHILRVGDVRLTCRTQVAYARAYKMAFNLLIGSLSAFSLDICGGEKRQFAAKAPIAYNKVTWMVGDQIVKVQALPSIQREFRVPVGDDEVADDTLLAFELENVQEPSPDRPTP